MYICIANNENHFLVLDTSDGVCEWTSIKDCRAVFQKGIRIKGLELRSIDKTHSYIDYSPSSDFVPKGICSELKSKCVSDLEYKQLLLAVQRFILLGNNIISLRRSCDSYVSFKRNLARWCYNG